MAYVNTTSWAMPKRVPVFYWIKILFKALMKRHTERLEYDRVLRLNDHMLRDIGLTCDDITEALNRPRRWF